MRKALTPEAIAKAINFPVNKWPGRCYGVARACLAAKLVKGRLSYGQFVGKIATTGTFAGRPISHHAWVELPDGRVWDPTRWVFEDVAPYLYIGPADDYDFGGNRVHEMLHGTECPAPTMPERVTLDLPLPIHLALYAVFKLPISTRRDGLASNQLHWLANANVQKLSRAHAKRLYLALITVGFGAHIPLDNRQRILGGK